MSATGACAVLSTKQAAIGCQALDLGTTIAALRGGATEANPVVASVINAAGIPGLVVMKIAVTYVLLHFREENPKAVAVANGVTCAAGVHNALL